MVLFPAGIDLSLRNVEGSRSEPPAFLAKSGDDRAFVVTMMLVETKTVKYKSFIRPDDKPAIWLNQQTMEKYRPQMKAFYYDPSKYDT